MRVRFTDHIFRIEPYGGVSRYITELHAGLLDRGIDSRVIAPLHLNGFLHRAEGVTGVDISAIHPHIFRQALAKGVDRAWSRVWWSRLDSDDIVHMTYFDSPLPSRGHLVATVYDMVHELFPQGTGRRDRTIDLKQRVCEAADVVLTISKRTRTDLLERYDLESERVIVTPLGVRAVAGLEDLDPLDRAPFVLYVGNRSRRYKNFERFVCAVSSSSVCRSFDIVCFGGGPFSPTEEHLFARVGMADRVVQTAGDDLALARHYRAAAALVYPSLYEGFGLPVLEAMVYDCPVAAAAAGAIPEVAGPAALLFEPSDRAEMTAAIDRILGDVSLRETLRAEGRRRVSLYTWDATVATTLRAYEHVVSRAPKDRS